MTRNLFLLTLLLYIGFNHLTFAKKQQRAELKQQKSEIRVWKKRKAAMPPLQLKVLIEENHRLKTQNQQLVEEAKFAKDALDAELIVLKMRIEAQKDELRKRERELSKAILHLGGLSEDDWATDKDGHLYIKGVVFKVQIGAYKRRDLSNVLEGKHPQEYFGQEQLEGVNMYTLRHFRSYSKANQFKKELRAMGLKDAWIVAFKDGKRVPLKEVLQEVIKSKKN